VYSVTTYIHLFLLSITIIIRPSLQSHSLVLLTYETEVWMDVHADKD